jgi:hypothetical protein
VSVVNDTGACNSGSRCVSYLPVSYLPGPRCVSYLPVLSAPLPLFPIFVKVLFPFYPILLNHQIGSQVEQARSGNRSHAFVGHKEISQEPVDSVQRFPDIWNREPNNGRSG